mmetsp:Transcript_70889/g.129716  ORF Transcript_70889/g.129716 Transcript_70889/m.129716 type:complete len:215 (-) Transcript_70889:163-807(-)
MTKRFASCCHPRLIEESMLGAPFAEGVSLAAVLGTLMSDTSMLSSSPSPRRKGWRAPERESAMTPATQHRPKNTVVEKSAAEPKALLIIPSSSSAIPEANTPASVIPEPCMFTRSPPYLATKLPAKLPQALFRAPQQQPKAIQPEHAKLYLVQNVANSVWQLNRRRPPPATVMIDAMLIITMLDNNSRLLAASINTWTTTLDVLKMGVIFRLQP